MSIYILIIVLFNVFYLVVPIHAALRLNEIYPAPQSGSFEWIELYNDESSSIEITDFLLRDLAANSILLPSTTAPPFGIIIATSSGILNNSGDTVFLKYKGDTVDIATYSGSFTSEKSSTRCPDGTGSWIITTSITKSLLNTSACPPTSSTPTLTPSATPTPNLPTVLPSPSSIIPASPSGGQLPTSNVQIQPSATSTPPSTPTQQLTVAPTPTPTPTPVSYNNIIISEVFPYPASGKNEWIELYNNNNFSVSLDNWYIDDEENKGSSPKVFSGTITPYSYFVIELTSSVFNNTVDIVRLLDHTQTEKDKTSYDQIPRSISWGRNSIDNMTYCTQVPSKNYPNAACVFPSATPTTTPSPVASLVTIVPSPTPTDSSVALQATIDTQSKALPFYENILDNDILPENESVAVLGTETSSHPELRSIQNLSILSFSLSLLSICSLLLKVRLNIV